MQYEIENIYVSCSSNRNPKTVTWGENGLIYYGSCNAVAVYDPVDTQQVLHTYCGHCDPVRSVRWISNSGTPSPPLLLSTSDDTTGIVWSVTPDKGLHLEAVLSGHSSSVVAGDGLQLSDGNKVTQIIVTTCVDSSVKIWKKVILDMTNIHSYEFSCVQTLRPGQGFCLDAKLQKLPGTEIPILACAMDDYKVVLFIWEEDSFQKKEVLIGHEDWVCCLDWVTLDDGDVMLASGSQDTYIRLWRISRSEHANVNRMVSQLSPDEEIKPEQKIFKTKELYFAIKLDSILLGHAAWVHSIAWAPPELSNDGKTKKQPLKLLTSSLDASVCVWEPDEVSGVWSPSARLGLIKENALGIQGCVWGPSGTCSVLAHTIQGSMHRWNWDGQAWATSFTIGGGHFGEVQDLSWEPGGGFLYSVSTDQTTRVHAPWLRPKHKPQEVWHELSRPQVHGYDLTCIAPISKFRFASGADEKIIRCFQASRQFKSCLKHISNVEISDIEMKETGGAEAASVPVLGLSNLSVTDVAEDDKALLLHDLDNVSEPLREELLWKSTLWPEERKLYGHGYELYCLAATHSGDLIASASKATLPEHAAILLWDTTTWQEMQKLPAHQLTVTQMAFSPDDKYLLSVSRDRRFSLFVRNKDSKGVVSYVLLYSSDKRTGIHTRIIWSCSWTPDSKYFVTGSREGTVVVWERDEESKCITASPPLTLSQSVTALAFAPCPPPYLLAVGMDDGSIALYEWAPGDKPESWILKIHLNKQLAHHKTVRRLAFRPLSSISSYLQLASCSSDHSVKLFNVHRIQL